MRVVFLDFDGVLNSRDFLRRQWDAGVPWGAGHIDPGNVSRLQEIVGATGAHVVISSTWRTLVHYSVLWEWLQHHGMRAKVLGVTPTNGICRGAEIDAWLRSPLQGRQDNEASWDGSVLKPVESFVILDDTDDMDPHMDRLVQTDYGGLRGGLQEEHVKRAIEQLERKWVTT